MSLEHLHKRTIRGIKMKYNIFWFNLGDFVWITIGFLSWLFTKDKFSLGVVIILFGSIVINSFGHHEILPELND